MISHNTGAVQREAIRERLRWQITREWKRGGRTSWTEAELDAEVDRRYEATHRTITARLDETQSPAAGPATTPPCQLTLFGRDDATRTTRSDAYVSSLQKAPTRRELIRSFVVACRTRGCTADEAAQGLGLPLHSVSGRFTELVKGLFNSHESQALHTP